jgi:hypothetical protein
MTENQFVFWIVFLSFMFYGEPDIWDALHLYVLRTLQ